MGDSVKQSQLTTAAHQLRCAAAWLNDGDTDMALALIERVRAKLLPPQQSTAQITLPCCEME